MPLTVEGLVLMVIPTNGEKTTISHKTRKSNVQAVYMFIPFGSYLVLPSTVNHSGVYGSKGNLRFHMTIRRRDDGNWGKDKFKFDATAKKFNSDMTNFENTRWRTSMIVGQSEYSEFTDTYTLSLVKRFGSLLDKNWMKLDTSPANDPKSSKGKKGR